MSDFLMPSLGADMEQGKLVDWLVSPGTEVRKGDVIAVVEPHKGAFEIDVFEMEWFRNSAPRRVRRFPSVACWRGSSDRGGLRMRGMSSEKRIVAVGPRRLEGVLRRPRSSSGLVIFAHGAGSSRLSTRNNHVADRFAGRGIASLLLDLLTEEEASDRANVFDIPLLSQRMVEAVLWARTERALSNLPIGLFGASTGAAAALTAAAQVPEDVRAVVSRGGRPDLAGWALDQVKAPTLLVVGGADHGVIELNEQAAAALRCRKRVAIVPGATHLFEEPGTLDQVVDLAADWFATHFGRGDA